MEELRGQMERNGLEASRLEEKGRLRLHTADGPPSGQVEELRRLVEEHSAEGSTVWADFNWDVGVEVEQALKEQRISEMLEEVEIVVKTSVLEEELDEWPGATQRRAQVLHSGTIWLSESGLSLSRVLPPPAS